MSSRGKKLEEAAGVKERLLDTADRLFYAEGIRAVGIDRVLAEAEAAKASLYQHFGSKDGLVAASVQRRAERGRVQVANFVESVPVEERALRIFDWIVAWVESPDFRGCPLQHVVGEIPDRNHPARKIAQEQREWFRKQFVDCLKVAGVGSPTRMAGALMVLYDGALAASEQDGPQRARDARWIAKQLLDSKRIDASILG
ncbi:MAG TPA: TetR/AcrR family transcriptional regulator [Terracidiphilus sp.]|jgi:AcrR family transcriptional regulator|nr:TetR/AcrR family transcriptional regulator [Terracidiphilus sp.]